MLKELCIQSLLKPGNPARNRRMIDTKLLRRRRQCLVPAHSEKEPQIIPCE
jgi:hypothetical protein